MARFSRLSKTIDYASFAITKEPGALPSDGEVSFAQIDPDAHPLIGEYRIERMLDDSGSQANVYLAKNHGQQFSLKLYRRGFSPIPEVQRVLSSGECPYIAPVLQSGRFQGEYWYEVFPFYSSGTLDDMISKLGKCPPRFVEKKLLPAIDGALHYLHSHHLIHADIKPQNIFISEDSQNVVLGDFGVAGLLPSSDGLVPFRGTLEYAPNASYGNMVRIDESYDYGALGLVLIKAYTGYSLFSGMSLEERNRAVASIHVPESIPAKGRSLIKGLLRSDPRSRYGHEKCREFLDEGKPSGTYASRRGRGRFASAEREFRQRTFEFGYFEGQMVIVSSGESLLAACEEHWDGARASIDTARLKAFLKLIMGGEEFYNQNVLQFKHRPVDERVFRFCYSLRKQIVGVAQHDLTYKGCSFSSIVQLLKFLSSNPESELMDILDGLALPDYLRAYEYGQGVASAAEEILALDQPRSVKANMLLAICDSDSHTIYIGGNLITSVNDFLAALMTIEPESLTEIVMNPSLKPWLHKHGCDFVIEEMEAFDEQ